MGRHGGDTLALSPALAAGVLLRAIFHEETALSFHKNDEVPSESCQKAHGWWVVSLAP